MRNLVLALCVLLIPVSALAHKTVECDGSEMIRIRAEKNGILQIRTNERITGVFPSQPQLPDFVKYDKGNPAHLVRLNMNNMQTDRANVHLNTLSHQCVLRIYQVEKKYNPVVNINFPPSQQKLSRSLPKPLRDSPLRQLWFRQWSADKRQGHPGVKVKKAVGVFDTWEEGLLGRILWEYDSLRYHGYTVQLTNTNSYPLQIVLSEIKDPIRSIHSMSLTDVFYLSSWVSDGTLERSEKLLLHIVYEKE